MGREHPMLREARSHGAATDEVHSPAPPFPSRVRVRVRVGVRRWTLLRHRLDELTLTLIGGRYAELTPCTGPARGL